MPTTTPLPLNFPQLKRNTLNTSIFRKNETGSAGPPTPPEVQGAICSAAIHGHGDKGTKRRQACHFALYPGGWICTPDSATLAADSEETRMILKTPKKCE